MIYYRGIIFQMQQEKGIIMAKNQVISGDYSGLSVSLTMNNAELGIGFLGINSVYINKSTVQDCQLMDASSRKSATSAVGRAAVGATLLGPVGLAAGLSAKNKGTYLVSVVFKTGEKSLIEIDDKLYKELLKIMY